MPTENKTTQKAVQVPEKPVPDYVIRNEGSLYLFSPQNQAAEVHLRDNVSPESMWFGNALVVEHRYAPELARALAEEGYIVQ